MRNEARFRMVEKVDADRFRRLMSAAQRDSERRHAIYEQLAGLRVPQSDEPTPTPTPPEQGKH